MPRYDLAGNPIDDDPPPNSGPYGQPPLGQAPGQPPAYGQAPGSFGLSSQAPRPYGAPPPAYGQAPYGGAPGYGQQGPGTVPPSGYSFNPFASNSSGTQGDIPVEIDQLKWNWGSFLLCRWWLRNHGMRMFTRILMISFIAVLFAGNALGGAFRSGVWGLYAVVNLGVAVYFGINGHKIAWRNRRFDSMQQYYAVQKAWMMAGLGVWAVLGVFWGIGIIAIVSTARTMATMPHSSSSYGGYGNGGGYGHHGYGSSGYGSGSNSGSNGTGGSDSSDDTGTSGTPNNNGTNSGTNTAPVQGYAQPNSAN